MRIELFYLLNLDNISKAEKTHLNNNINSIPTIPKEAYVNKGTLLLPDVKKHDILNNAFKNKLEGKIQQENLKKLEKGDIIVDKFENRPYILTDYNFKPVSWREIR